MREKTDSHSAYLLSETGMERLRDVYRDGLL